jgi:uncharacterized Ntn-hydrolase superfamily protein
MLGVAIASRYLAVGAVCSHTRSSVGAIATQAYGNPYLGIDGLALLAQGHTAAAALAEVLAGDPGRDKRQLLIIDRQGGTAVHTGAQTTPWCGHIEGTDYVVAGNMLAGPAVIEAMASAFEASAGEELAERLLSALEAGDLAGGDKRGKQAAHLEVVDREVWKYVDLRVDDHPEPIAELRRIFEVAKTDLFPFRQLYPTRAQPGADWDLQEYERLSSAVKGH